MRLLSVLLILGFLAACGSSSSTGSDDDRATIASETTYSLDIDDYQAGLAIPDNQSSQHYKVLMFGNSHLIGIPDVLKLLVDSALPGKSIEMSTARGNDYLAERLRDGHSVNLLLGESWTHLILQAQKYSQSGSIEYPTDAAQTFIRMAKSDNVTPVLFPEHPQYGKTTEGERVHNIHQSIVEIEASCLAPVGLTWDNVIQIAPSLKLHNTDGNHAAKLGTLLTSLVIYQTITGESADLIPYIDALDVDEATQNLLGQIASQTVLAFPPCNY